MTDYTVGDTVYKKFSTRAFATGAPTTLAGTPVVSAYEDDSLVQITAGITLTVDFDGVTGLNHLTIVATGANGFETGKDYSLVITTGTVGGVSVVGEVIGEFSLGRSAAAADLANATDGLGALKTLLDDIPTVAEFEARTLVSGSYFDPATDAVATVTSVTGAVTVGTNNDKTGYSLTQAFPTNFADLSISATTGLVDITQTAADKVWSTAIRLLTAGTNIVLAKGVGITGFNDLSAAQVNSEVVDGLNVDTYAEPAQGSPPATISIRQMLHYLYKWTRNKKDNDGATTQFYNDAGTVVDHKQATSEAAGVVTKGEIATGP